MSRSDQRRRRALRAAAPIAGLLAVGLLVWQGSTAAFSATTDNGSENWATGSMTLTNDGGVGTAASYQASTTALFNDTNLKIPSAAVTKCLSVKAGGTTGGTLNFYRGAITGTNSAALAPQINVIIKASAVTTTQPAAGCAGFVGVTNVTPVAGTALSALPTVYSAVGGTVVPAGTQYVTYQITYQLTAGASNAADNLLQGSNATAVFDWELQ